MFFCQSKCLCKIFTATGGSFCIEWNLCNWLMYRVCYLKVVTWVCTCWNDNKVVCSMSTTHPSRTLQWHCLAQVQEPLYRFFRGPASPSPHHHSTVQPLHGRCGQEWPASAVPQQSETSQTLLEDALLPHAESGCHQCISFVQLG